MDRCEMSDLPVDQCAHCRGSVAGETVGLTPAPRPTREHVAAPSVPELAPVAPVPPPRTRRYPVLCALGLDCRRGDQPRATGGRSWVCQPCEDRVRGGLLELAGVWPDLEAALTVPAPPPDTEPRKGGTDPASGLRLNERVVETRADVAAHVERFAGVARLAWGGSPASVTVPGLLRWLAVVMVPRLLAHPDEDVAVAFAAETLVLARRAWSAAYPNGTRRVRVPGVSCQARVEDGGCCPGELFARIRPGGMLLPDLVCTVDPEHSIPPSVWRRRDWQARHATPPSLRRA